MLRKIDGPSVSGSISVGTTPVEIKVGATALDDRAVLHFQPQDGEIYIGYDNSVSTSSGTLVFESQTVFIEAGDKMSVWAVAASGTVDVRVGELS